LLEDQAKKTGVEEVDDMGRRRARAPGFQAGAFVHFIHWVWEPSGAANPARALGGEAAQPLPQQASNFACCAGDENAFHDDGSLDVLRDLFGQHCGGASELP